MVAPFYLAGAAEKPMTEKEKIGALINSIENLKDATFIRNDSGYDAKTAARFLRGKWRREQKDIKTAMDFINKVGSVSSTSGKHYVIRFKGGGEVKCGEYLKEELKKLEKDKPEQPGFIGSFFLHRFVSDECVRIWNASNAREAYAR